MKRMVGLSIITAASVLALCFLILLLFWEKNLEAPGDGWAAEASRISSGAEAGVGSAGIAEADIGEDGIAEDGSAASSGLPEEPERQEGNEEPGENEEPAEYDVVLMALGDNLLHEGIVNTGRRADGSYDYSFLFEGVADFLALADIKAINQETIFGGNHLGFPGYPRFNSPTQVGDAIAAAGFNVVLHATNHAADQGIEGIYHCAGYWEEHPEVLMAGISGKEERERIQLLEIKGITFAILNYTYSPNTSTLSSELMGHLNMLCAYNENTGAINFTALNPQVAADIKEAERMADVVVVFPHWGTEYRTEPSGYQRIFAEEMTQAGADLIIGTHPHVPQPVEWVVSENGNKALCYFSLGNYASLQKNPQCMLEGMAWVTFHVDGDGVSLSEEKTGVLLLVCHYKRGSMHLERIYLLEEYTEELAYRHGIQDYEGYGRLRLPELQRWSREIFGGWTFTREELEKGSGRTAAGREQAGDGGVRAM